MDFMHHVSSLIENEILSQLEFQFSIVANRSRPGAQDLRKKDRVEFEVYACNRSSIPMHDIEGAIFPALIADFEARPFKVEELPARHRIRICVLQAVITLAPGTNFSLDQVGTVTVTARADLSRLRFRELAKPLVFARPVSRRPPAISGSPAPTARATGQPNFVLERVPLSKH